MHIVSQFPHFWEDKEGESHRNMLQIEIEDAKMEGNFPDNGTVMIRLQDEDSQKAFKLDPKEALTIGEELQEVSKELLKQERELWEKKGKSKD